MKKNRQARNKHSPLLKKKEKKIEYKNPSSSFTYYYKRDQNLDQFLFEVVSFPLIISACSHTKKK